jgi:hypothetical protein
MCPGTPGHTELREVAQPTYGVGGHTHSAVPATGALRGGGTLAPDVAVSVVAGTPETISQNRDATFRYCGGHPAENICAGWFWSRGHAVTLRTGAS